MDTMEATMGGMAGVPIVVVSVTCARCGHTWLPRQQGIPKKCPRCQTKYWRVGRKKEER